MVIREYCLGLCSATTSDVTSGISHLCHCERTNRVGRAYQVRETGRSATRARMHVCTCVPVFFRELLDRVKLGDDGRVVAERGGDGHPLLCRQLLQILCVCASVIKTASAPSTVLYSSTFRRWHVIYQVTCIQVSIFCHPTGNGDAHGALVVGHVEDGICRLFCLVHGIGHGHAPSDQFEHLNIVLTVSQCHDCRRFDLEHVLEHKLHALSLTCARGEYLDHALNGGCQGHVVRRQLFFHHWSDVILYIRVVCHKDDLVDVHAGVVKVGSNVANCFGRGLAVEYQPIRVVVPCLADDAIASVKHQCHVEFSGEGDAGSEDV